jgi:Ca2+-binding EF-hand superfamily protein
MDILAIVNPILHGDIARLEHCIRVIFERVDRNESGNMTRNELATFLGDLSAATRVPRKQQANRLVLANDHDHNQTLDISEFRGMLLKKLNATNLETVLNSLQVILDTHRRV